MHLIARTTLVLSALALGACSGSTKATAKKAATGAASQAVEAAKTEAAKGNIVEVAMGAGQFNTLVTAVKAAGLVETLSGPGPFTVFAPTDAAFAKLPAGTVEALLKDKEKLTAILTYHVVAAKVMAADVGGLTEAKTVNGAMLPIDTSDGVMVGKGKVVKADVGASNGVIHVVDTVLLPE